MSSFENNVILVTGANGFIGRHLCQRLSDLGASIHGVARNKEKHQSANVQWWYGDLAKNAFTNELIKSVQPDILFHLASYVAGHRELAAVQPSFKSNLQSSVNILIAVSETECRRIVLAGSQEEPEASESSYSIPSSPYAAAKWATSAYARMCHALYQTPVTIARIHMVYGPGQKDHNKLIPYTILSLLKSNAPSLTRGDRLVDWIFIEDLIEGLVAIAKTDTLNGQTVDLGTGKMVTVREVVQKISELMKNDTKILFGSRATRQMEQVRMAKVDETYRLLGWRPRTTLESGLTATIDWYRNLQS